MPLALTRRGWGFAVSAVVLWASWFAVGLSDVWYAAALLAALVAVGALVATAAPLVARFDVRQSVTDPTPASGEVIAATVRLRHRLPWALRCDLLWTAGEETLRSPATVAPRGETIAEIAWEATRRGPHPVGVGWLLVNDPFGLVVRRVAVRSTPEVLVLPRLLPSVPEDLRGGAGPEGDGIVPVSRSASPDPGSPGGAVRDYRMGDPLRQIHWKQSARQGELLVNLHEQFDAPERTLALLTDGAYDSDADFETAVSAAATVASRWLRDGYTARLILGGDEPVACTREAEALRLLALVRREGGPAAPPAAQVVVTGAITSALRDALGRRGEGGVVIRGAADDEPDLPAAWRCLTVSAGDAAEDPHEARRAAHA